MSCVTIRLSKDPAATGMDTSEVGYQPPLPESEVSEEASECCQPRSLYCTPQLLLPLR